MKFQIQNSKFKKTIMISRFKIPDSKFKSAVTALALVLGLDAAAADWPDAHGNERRSMVSPDQPAKQLKELWAWQSPVPLNPAWSAPAKWDAYQEVRDLPALRDFDASLLVSGAAGKVYFGSNGDNSVRCLDLASGKPLWAHAASAPVRLPPSVRGDRLYFGDDSGAVTCLDTAGKLIWSRQADPQARIIPSNGRLVSLAPVRTGVLEKDGRLYFAASLVPWEPSRFCCWQASDGKEIYQTRQEGRTLEGPLLLSGGRVIVPQGRAPALSFALGDGKFLGDLDQSGSTWILVDEGGSLFSGPRKEMGGSQVVATDPESQQELFSLGGATRLVSEKDLVWVQAGDQLKLFDRGRHLAIQAQLRSAEDEAAKLKKAKDPGEKELRVRISALRKDLEQTFRWSVPAPRAAALLKAAERVFLAADGCVVAYDAASGKEVQRLPVPGRVLGLAMIDGVLIASTELGGIHAFR
ncbi:MAG: hypothetical protein RL095_2300 [Verrucomicrobiota bacterium]|jgi:outer membrane protein assembly factor BamB